MNQTPLQISVSEILAAGVRPYPDEAIALIQQVCRHRLRGSPGVLKASLPTLESLMIDGCGNVAFFGAVIADGSSAVVHLARLLNTLLPEAGSAVAFHVPSALTVTLVRALSEVVLPTFGSIEAFSRRLEPFEPEDTHEAVRCLFERWRQRDPNQLQASAIAHQRDASGVRDIASGVIPLREQYALHERTRRADPDPFQSADTMPISNVESFERFRRGSSSDRLGRNARPEDEALAER